MTDAAGKETVAVQARCEPALTSWSASAEGKVGVGEYRFESYTALKRLSSPKRLCRSDRPVATVAEQGQKTAGIEKGR